MAFPSIPTNPVDSNSRKTVSTAKVKRTTGGSVLNYPKLPNRKYIEGAYAYTSIQMREYAKKCVESALRQKFEYDQKQRALDVKAENARKLGLDYTPVDRGF